MLTANKLVPAGRGLASVLLKRASSVELDWDVRSRSRFDATDSAGRALGVFLPRGTVVRGGDVLVVEDGSLVQVQAAPQPVLVVRHCTEHGSPFDLLRAAYHLGNRHVAIELQPDHLKLEPDHVLAEMLRRMHLIVTEEQAAFEPEGGLIRREGDMLTGTGTDTDTTTDMLMNTPLQKTMGMPIAIITTTHTSMLATAHMATIMGATTTTNTATATTTTTTTATVNVTAMITATE